MFCGCLKWLNNWYSRHLFLILSQCNKNIPKHVGKHSNQLKYLLYPSEYQRFFSQMNLSLSWGPNSLPVFISVNETLTCTDLAWILRLGNVIAIKAFSVNTLTLRQKWTSFHRQHFKCIFLMKIFGFWLKFHWSLFPRVQLTISRHWFR